MTWERVPVVDEYAEDGELVVLLEDGRVLALTELPAAILERLGGSTATSDEIAAHVVGHVGFPVGGPADEVIAEVLRQMSELGLIRAL